MECLYNCVVPLSHVPLPRDLQGPISLLGTETDHHGEVKTILHLLLKIFSNGIIFFLVYKHVVMQWLALSGVVLVVSYLRTVFYLVA